MMMRRRNAAACVAVMMSGVCFAGALPPASQWAYEELTNMLDRITGEIPEVSMVLPGSALADEF